MGNESRTFFYILGIVALQLTLAVILAGQPWWALIGAAYLVGTVCNHALYVMVHEATHNLVFKSSVTNRLLGIFSDWPLVTPGAMAFRKYHLTHHTRMGQFDIDADLVGHREARIFSALGAVGKAVWVGLLGVSQAMRPLRIRAIRFWDRWILLNVASQVVVVGALLWIAGPWAILYLMLSSVLALGGLHPLGGRWIAEHFVTTPGQETYSYYGFWNRVSFNVGHHVEHHDFMTIPWRRLPRLRRLAPELYDTLDAHPSYGMLTWKFVTDPKLTLWSRYVRPLS